MSSKKPDYILKAMHTPSIKGKVGAAWLNSDGSISVDLDPFVVLKGQDMLNLTLFVNDKKGIKDGD